MYFCMKCHKTINILGCFFNVSGFNKKCPRDITGTVYRDCNAINQRQQECIRVIEQSGKNQSEFSHVITMGWIHQAILQSFFFLSYLHFLQFLCRRPDSSMLFCQGFMGNPSTEADIPGHKACIFRLFMQNQIQ